MTSTQHLPLVAFLCYCLCFFSCQSNSDALDAAFKITDALLLTGTIVPNPNYVVEDDDQNAYIVTSLYGADVATTSIGVQMEEEAFLFLVSCVYVFEEVRLADMAVVGASCDAFPVAPYEVEVASERIQFLMFEPSDEFWACWVEEGRGELSFRVWVRGNEAH